MRGDLEGGASRKSSVSGLNARPSSPMVFDDLSVSCSFEQQLTLPRLTSTVDFKESAS
jgi:hypothetical protein